VERLQHVILGALGMVRGVSHTEFIQSRDYGRICFLETSERVGGAYIAELVEMRRASIRGLSGRKWRCGRRIPGAGPPRWLRGPY
jgi:hypothetical protein